MNMTTEGTCSSEGCNLEIKAKGLCSKHHQQWYRAIHNKTKPSRRRKICSIVGCGNVGKSTDIYCRSHQRKFVLYGDPFGGRIVQRFCTMDGCTGVHLAKGLCKKHYARKFNKKSGSSIKNMSKRMVAINQMIKDPVWDDLLKLYSEKVALTN